MVLCSTFSLRYRLGNRSRSEYVVHSVSRIKRYFDQQNATPRPIYKRLSQLQRYNTGLLVFTKSPRSIHTPQTCLKFSKGSSGESTLSASIRELTKPSHLASRKPYWPAKYVAGLHRLFIGNIENLSFEETLLQ